VSALPPIRVLIVDDSRVGRHVIADALAASKEIVVVGHASNGEQALRMVAELSPDAITLDLEMPKMGGFTFLRLLMSRRPTPVVVLSSQSHRENVFKALELGALDFIPKPEDVLSAGDALRAELVEKVLLTRHAHASLRRAITPFAPSGAVNTGPISGPPRFVVAVASSTGGPAALLHIFSRLPATFPSAVLIAQHMAQSFTRTFAERLDRSTPLSVREAMDGDLVTAGRGYVCPGGSCMSVRKENGVLRLTVSAPGPEDRYVPNANKLLASAAACAGNKAVGVILTGMADDGTLGAGAIRAAGGRVFAESQETAVVFGMPNAAAKAGNVDAMLSLPLLADRIAALG
jgi:two-component system chemotaxis response regulator CheB